MNRTTPSVLFRLVAIFLVGRAGIILGADSTWQGEGSGTWHNEANWVPSVPDDAADLAVFSTLPAMEASIDLLADVVLRRLEIENQNPIRFTSNTNAILQFAPLSSQGQINLGSRADVTFDVAVVARKPLSIVNAGERLTFAGPVATGDHELRIRGSRPTTLLTNNPGIQGPVSVRQGILSIHATDSLGSHRAGDIDGTTVHRDGVLIVENSILDLPEPLIVDGGRVIANDNLLSGPIKLESSGGRFLNAAGLTGPITGVGDFVLENSVLASSQISTTGAVIIQADRSSVSTDNNFPGNYIVRSGQFVVTAHNGLGLANGRPDDATIVEENGILVLDVAVPQQERIVVDGGQLTIKDGVELDGHITLNGGVLTGGTHGGVIELGATNQESWIGRGSISGQITGPGSVRFSPSTNEEEQLVIDGENTYSGISYVQSGRVQANSPQAFGLTSAGTRISGGVLDLNTTTREPLSIGGNGQLELNAIPSRLPTLVNHDDRNSRATLSINTDAEFDDSMQLRNAALVVNRNVRLSAIHVGPNGLLDVAEEGHLQTANGSVQVSSGLMRGHLGSVEQVEKRSGTTATIRSAASPPVLTTVFDGVLEFQHDEETPMSIGTVHVHDGATLRLAEEGVFDGNIVLHGAVGLDQLGALSTEHGDSAFFSGAVKLEGSKVQIGGAPLSELVLAGPVSGNDLVIVGNGNIVQLTSPQNSFSGSTSVHSFLFLSGAGTLGNSRSISVHPGGQFIIANSPEVVQDRIPNDTRVELAGGDFRVRTKPNEVFDEIVGDIHLLGGHSVFAMVTPGRDPEPIGTLRGGSIDRRKGSTVQFGFDILEGVQKAEVHLAAPPPLTNELIGGWAIAKVDALPMQFSFASYDGDKGVRPVNAVANFSMGPTSNVALDAPLVLSESTVVNSLSVARDAAVDLGGETLTLKSGGLILEGRMSNGILTSEGSELFVFGDGAGHGLDVQIADNDAGPVDLVVSGLRSADRMLLNGESSYSGNTYFNRVGVTVQQPTSLGNTRNITLTDANLVLDEPGDALHFDSVTLRRGKFFAVGQPVSFDTFDLFEGELEAAQLTGTGVLRKLGSTPARLGQQANLDAFSGRLEIHDGNLRVNTDVDSTPVLLQGGRLELDDNKTVASSVELQGGQLLLNKSWLAGTVHVAQPAELVANASRVDDSGLSGRLIGGASLTINARDANNVITMQGDNAEYTGRMVVEGGSVVFRHERSFTQGPILVEAAGEVRWVAEPPAGLMSPQDLTLNGGVLRVDSGRTFHRHLGTLTISGDSVVVVEQGELQLSDVVLLDGSRVVMGGRRLDIGGLIDVRGSSTIVLGDALGRSGGLQSLTGTIRPGSDKGSLEIQSIGFEAVTLLPSFEIPDGRSLEIFMGDELATIDLADGQSIRGGGTFLNDVRVRSGSVVSPQSAVVAPTEVGVLTLGGDLIVEGGALEWHVADAPGGMASDLLVVTGEIVTDNENNWTLKVLPLGGELQNFSAFRTEKWPLLQAAEASTLSTTITVDAREFENANPDSLFGQFRVLPDEQGLSLEYSLPADIDDSGIIDAVEIDTLCRAIGTANDFYDFDGDQKVTLADQQLMLSNLLRVLPGDTDLNQRVGFPDFLSLAGNFGNQGGWADGDFNCDFHVGFGDFLLIASNFGSQPVANVPEPRVGLLLCLLSCPLLRRRGSRVAPDNGVTKRKSVC